MYERKLIDYLPNFLKEYREIKAIMNDAEQPEMQNFWGLMDNALDDQFITTATEDGVARWEKCLNITPKASFTLDERKFTILTRINEQTPFTMTSLKESLTTLCGADGFVLELNSAEYTLNVKLALTALNNFTDVENLLKQVVPANIVVNVVIMYNQHDVLAEMTHQELEAYSHDDIRKEVFE